ncbi:MAG: PH domain-containing protein [Sarcina sp.]
MTKGNLKAIALVTSIPGIMILFAIFMCFRFYSHQNFNCYIKNNDISIEYSQTASNSDIINIPFSSIEKIEYLNKVEISTNTNLIQTNKILNQNIKIENLGNALAFIMDKTQNAIYIKTSTQSYIIGFTNNQKTKKFYNQIELKKTK